MLNSREKRPNSYIALSFISTILLFSAELGEQSENRGATLCAERRNFKDFEYKTGAAAPDEIYLCSVN
jgi:hypothetical protein